MDDADFIRRIQDRIQESTGVPVTLELDHDQRDEVEVFFTDQKPRIVMGADALEHAGLARMFIQYAILSIREGRKVTQDEFTRFLRRN
jgi:protein-disulfide isomerase-like protein with CxxC motif